MRQIVLLALLGAALAASAIEITVQIDSERPGKVYWDGVDKQGSHGGGSYSIVRLLMVHTNGIYTPFECRLAPEENDDNWSGKGRRLTVQVSEEVLKKIQSGGTQRIRSKDLAERQDIRTNRPDQTVQGTGEQKAARP